ncbi:MAG: hypothetical protein ACRDD4_10030, partial [Culicoidibacterales bacterium]
MKKRKITLGILVFLLIGFIFGYETIEPILTKMLPTGSSLFVQRTEIVDLFFQHLQLVAITISLALTIGLGVAFLEQFDESNQIRPLMQQLGTVF